MAVGRNPNTKYLNLQKIGIQTNKNNGKIIGGHNGHLE